MSNPDTWLQIGNFIAIIVMFTLFVQYVLRTDWNTSETGRALAWLIMLSLANFLINLLGVLTEEIFVSWLRVVVKLGIACGLLNLLRILQKARAEALTEKQARFNRALKTYDKDKEV